MTTLSSARWRGCRHEKGEERRIEGWREGRRERWGFITVPSAFALRRISQPYLLAIR